MSKDSDLKRAFTEDGAHKTHVGGQALLEGVMMRGRYNWGVAVREPAGNIYTEEHDLASGRPANSWLRWPIIRGCTAFVESLMLGYKALEIAAIHAFADEEEAEGASYVLKTGGADASRALEADGAVVTAVDAEAPVRATADVDAAGSAEASAPAQPANPAEPPAFSWKRDFGNPDEMIDALCAQRTLEVVTEPASAPEPDKAIATPDKASDGNFGHTEMVISMVLGVVLGVALFIIVPAFLTNLIVGEYDEATLAWNLVDGVLRVAVFIFYIWLIGRMQEIKTMFSYHGAEHKTIHCYEHGLPLTPANARSFPRLHVRCGTAFLIMVMIIAILVYTITPLNSLIAAWGVPDGAPKLVLVIIVRILLMPVIAGVSYEITVKWAGSHPDNPVVKIILWPGMQMQYLTTREPNDGQLECAIAAMQLVLEREEREMQEATAPVGCEPSCAGI